MRFTRFEKVPGVLCGGTFPNAGHLLNRVGHKEDELRSVDPGRSPFRGSCPAGNRLSSTLVRSAMTVRRRKGQPDPVHESGIP